MVNKRTLWLVTTALGCVAQPALAQDQQSAADAPQDIVVTGYRASLEQARDLKRKSAIIQDSIAADDIAAFPDLNLAEAIQRLPGVAINREAGEGRRISLRGLGPDFTRVQLNGMEVLGNVDSPQDSRGQNSRDRAFDFNLFAAELFNRVDVEKSYQAIQTEGGLAGTVGLHTGRPFDYAGTKAVVSAQLGTNTLTKDAQPRFTGLLSKNWGNFGVLISGAYSHRNTREEGFDTYRWRRNKANGSDVSALTADQQAKIASGDLRFARGNRLSVWDSTQDRLGLTAAIQWKPSDKINLALDGLYGEFKADRFETHLASRGGGGSTWLGGAQTFAGVTYKNSKINQIHWNDQNEVDYLDVDGANTATETRTQKTKNIFKQLVLSGDAALSDNLKFFFTGGVERSSYDMPVSDKFYLEAYGGVISDYRGGTYSLVNTYKWDTGNPALWHAHNLLISSNYQDSAFDTAKGRFEFSVSPDDKLSFGGEWRRFENSGYSRGGQVNVYQTEFQTGKVSANIANYAQVYTGYSGQNWVVVDYNKALSQLGIDRNAYLGPKLSVYGVEERTGAAFAQYDWDHHLGSLPFRGNIGVRYYRTDLTSSGFSTGTDSKGNTIGSGSASIGKSYDGVLPAMNLTLELQKGLQVRFSAAKNINRPTLSALAANASVSLNDDGTYSVSVGNPDLKPYKSTDLNLSIEHYFGRVGYVALGGFYKHLDGFIATKTLSNVPYSITGQPTTLAPNLTPNTIITSYSIPVNLDGTDLVGMELAGQADFTFLPAPFDHFGASGNFTYLDSKYDYRKIYGADAIRTTLEGLSHVNANATLYYQDARFDARVSVNYRSGYVYSASPVSTSLGKDQDLTGYAPTTYVDASAHYNLTSKVQLTLDAINLTNQREKQYSDSTQRLYVVTRAGTTVMGGVRISF
ncbi:TonB-dependent receptor [uncultured Sphingomonas sp.]|uniref:TonB-dependent receptor n=1 Tax=uncultured Sphingomonas sp. TaxID=158754 RepID=UPI0025F9DDCD|nr:TonB-dependent receptor [uncultured Sphingomonas sp.]